MTKELINYRVTETTHRVEFDLYGPITHHEAYEELISELHKASEKDVFILRINSPGGRVDVGMMIVKAIYSAKCLVLAQVVYPSASMASVIACACDGLYLDRNTHLMFHTYSGGTYGKADEMLQDTQETHLSIDGMFAEAICPFITKAELKRIRDGKDIYIRASDETLKARIKRHFKVEIQGL